MKSGTEFGALAEKVYQHKYAMALGDGTKESWATGTAVRVATSVCGPFRPALVDPIRRRLAARQFMPGGRYLYAAGRKYHQVNNCFHGGTKVLTREGDRRLDELAASGKPFEVLNRHGVWEQATARSFGTQRLWRVRLSNGQTLLTTKDHRWWMLDGSRVTTDRLTEVPLNRMKSMPALDEEAVRHGIIFGDGHLNVTRKRSCVRLIGKKQQLAGCFPDDECDVTVGSGSVLTYKRKRLVKTGPFIGLYPPEYKSLPETYSPEYARGFIAGLIATDGCVNKTGGVTVSCKGYERAVRIASIAAAAGCEVTSVRAVTRETPYSRGVPVEMGHVNIRPWSAPLIRPDQAAIRDGRQSRTGRYVVSVQSVEDTGEDAEVFCVVAPQSESFTLSGGLLTSNCSLLRVHDSRKSWAGLMQRVTNMLMTGMGVGVVYSEVRGKNSSVGGLGGQASGPCALMQMVNETGRHIQQGGSRRSALWAGLHWDHPDVFDFVHLKDWPEWMRKAKETDFNAAATMDGTNISVILDDAFFHAFHNPRHRDHAHAQKLFYEVVGQMCRTGEPGFSVDVGRNAGENLRNACTEVTSRDDDDVCNLASLNMARFDSLDDFRSAVREGTEFLICGTLYSDLPTAGLKRVREKNRRLGLGLMGMHEWLLRRGKPYGPDDELRRWLEAYRDESDAAARACADELSVSRPVARRAIAPTGTISIIAETTSGIEPIFAVSFKRRYLKGDTWHAQYVVDAAAQRLIQDGVRPDAIEDAYSLAADPERRLGFQAFVQEYVDMGISSTLNLPAWGSDGNNPGRVQQLACTMLDFLPRLRGMTAYPDGSRGGQPLVPVPYGEAVSRAGVEVVEYGNEVACPGGACGI